MCYRRRVSDQAASASAGAAGASATSTLPADWREYLVLSDEALLRQCETDRFRASGPGGQKRNKTDSAVRVRHRPSGLAAEATESRSQHENRARALHRLRRAIAFGLRAPLSLEPYRTPPELAAAIRQPGRPGPQGGSRRPGGLEMGRRDARFLPAVAALFDLLEATEWRIATAARALGVSTGALGRFLASDVQVLRAANLRRVAHGQRPLRRRA